MRIAMLTSVLLAVWPALARADDPIAAPPPTATTCKANADCATGTVCGAGVCVLAPTPAPNTSPAAPAPSAADISSAQVHLKQGQALFESGDNSAALAEWQEAYRLYPAAFILKDIGLAQQKLFLYAEAVDSLQAFLDQTPFPSPPDPQQTLQIIAEIKSLLADVALTVSPAGATITIDSRNMGTFPLAKPLKLAAGSHVIEVTADGYKSDKRTLVVAAGVATAFHLELVAIPKTGKIRITSTVPRTMVSIDGQAKGVTPLEVELGPGGHALEMSAPKYRVHRSDITVEPGTTRDVTIPLDLDTSAVAKPWYMNKYIWIGAGVVVLGVGLGIEFGTHQGPVDGTLGTGVVP